MAALAIASMPMQAVSAILRQFGPDSLVVESTRPEDSHCASPVYVEGVDSVWYVSPGWRSARTRIPPSKHVGPLPAFAHYAFSLGWYTLIQGAKYRLDEGLPLAEISEDWLTTYGKPQIDN